MSGLKLISTATTESYSERTENKELYPKDGDQIFLTSLPTGDPLFYVNDTWLDLVLA